MRVNRVAVAPGKRDADARLNDRETSPPGLRSGIDDHLIQRMRDGLHHSARGPRRQLRVGIERDHVANRQRQRSRMEDLCRAFTAQERVQLFDLAALTFAADPTLLALGPDPAPVKQQEASARVARVQLGDSVVRRLQQFGIARRGRFGGIGEIGKQAEEEICFLIGKKTDFQLLDLPSHYLHARQHHRHHHQRGVLRRNAVSEVHFRQWLRRQQRNDQRVNDLDGQFAQREQRQDSEHRQQGLLAHAGVPGQSQRQRRKA